MPLLLEDTAPQPSTSFWNRFLKNKDNPNSFITFRENDLQMNMSYSYDTPFGYYFYPVTEAYKKLKNSENFSSAIPFAGDRPLIVWADLDRSFSNKILRVDKDGNSQFSNSEIVELGKRAWKFYLTLNGVNDLDENYATAIIKLFDQYIGDERATRFNIDRIVESVTLALSRKGNSYYSVNNDISKEFYKICEDILNSNRENGKNHIKLYDDDLDSDYIIDKVNQYADEYYKYSKINFDVYTRFLEDAAPNKKKTRTNSFWYFTYRLCNDAKKWTRLLYKLGFVGVVDEGSGTIHTNEPYQAVFFVSAALGGLTVYNNPKEVTQLIFNDEDIKKREVLTKNDAMKIKMEKIVEFYNSSVVSDNKISYNKENNIISGDMYLSNLTNFYLKKIISISSGTLPECFHNIIINGDFGANGLGLKSLKNFPRKITGYCDVGNNPLQNLNSPLSFVGNSFYCRNTEITQANLSLIDIGGWIELSTNINLISVNATCKDKEIFIKNCPVLDFKLFPTETLLEVVLTSSNYKYKEWIEELNIRGYDNNKQPIKKESFKLTSNKFKDYLLREEVFNRGQLDLDAAWEVYQKQYLKSTGNTFTKELFIDRARNWTFYGNIDGWVAIRHQASGYVKLVAVAGSMKGKYYGMEELLKTNPPLWGAVTSDIAEMLKKRGFIVPNYITMKILIASVPPAVFGGKKVNINLDGSINVDYDGIGSVKKWFVCNKIYIKKFLNENENIPAIAKTAIGAFL